METFLVLEFETKNHLVISCNSKDLGYIQKNHRISLGSPT